MVLTLCNLRWWCFSFHQLAQILHLYSWWSSQLALVVFFLRALAHLLMRILQLALCGGGACIFMWWWLYICGDSGCTRRFCCCYTTEDPSLRASPVRVYTVLRTDSRCPMYCARIRLLSLARPGVSENVTHHTLARHLLEHLYTPCLLSSCVRPVSSDWRFIVSSQ